MTARSSSATKLHRRARILYDVGAAYETGKYFNFEIRTDPLNNRILYFVDGDLIFTGALFEGTSLESVLMAHLNYQTEETFDIDNFRVATLVDEQQHAGEYRVTFNASGLASGVYLYRLQAESFTKTERMVLVKWHSAHPGECRVPAWSPLPAASLRNVFYAPTAEQ